MLFCKVLRVFVICFSGLAPLSALSNPTPLTARGNGALPPYAFFEGAQQKGIVVDLAEAVFGSQEMDVNVVLGDWSRQQDLVKTGDGQILLHINPTPERLEWLVFSDAFVPSEIAIFHRNDTFAASLEDLDGLTVGVEDKGYPISLVREKTAANLRIVDSWAQAFTLLSHGSIDAVVVDRWVGGYVLSQLDFNNILESSAGAEQSFSRIAVPKQHADLIPLINRGLDTIRRDGTYNEILTRWSDSRVVYSTIEEQRLTEYLRFSVIGIVILLTALVFYTLKLRSARKLIASYANELESEVAFKTRVLQETLEERDQAISDMKHANERRSQLFGVIAHELRTPVAAINMMAADDDNSEWENSKVKILRSSNDLLNTIDDMRLLINPEIKRPLRYEAFTVKDLNATVTSSVASIVASTGVQYQQYNAIALPLVDDEFTADTYRVRVVITNLVKNACLHSRGTHVWMFSRMAMDSQGGEYLEWVVGDNGTGIPEGQIDGLFEAGARGDSVAEGTGFGLYIAKNWIEEIDGSIRYHPRKKGGSEFIVRLPLLPADSQTATTHDQAPEIHTKLEDVLPKLNVLLAEDEAMLRMLAQKLLSRMVGSIKAAQDGREGVEQFDSTINLVLTDYFMPEMSGVEFAKQLRQQGYTGVILGITAATIGEQRQDLLDAGVDMVLPKPLNAEMFRNSISQLLCEGRFSDLLDEGAADA